MSGDDALAKYEVARLPRETCGWTRIIALGDITTARGPETMTIVWLALLRSLHTPLFNFVVVAYA